jgi:hypothetical protein
MEINSTVLKHLKTFIILTLSPPPPQVYVNDFASTNKKKNWSKDENGAGFSEIIHLQQK